MSNYPLFSVIGIEIEYMIVNKKDLSIIPKSDFILRALAGKQVNEVAMGDIAISNELVLHVLELKNNGPRAIHEPLARQFQDTILALKPLLDAHDLQLLPTGAHPWMNPLTETQRWPHGDNAIYQQFDRIFNCQGHGWSNLQSMHVNLPFANDEEFCQLHNSIRLLLPLLPALAASTPVLEGKKRDVLDARLQFYGQNQKNIPSISGDIIPAFVSTQKEYQEHLLKPMYLDIAPLDPKGILQHEWLNSRGAIAKFDSMAIEIRILDTQECVYSDLAIAKAIHAILKSWKESGPPLSKEASCETKPLKNIYDQAIKTGLSAVIEEEAILPHWQLPKKKNMTIRDVLSMLIERISHELDNPSQRALEHILTHGNLSERILTACHNDYSQQRLLSVYRQLGDCLLENRQFYTS